MRVHVDAMTEVAHRLTPRQMTVVTMLSDGLMVKQIANELGISARTVDNHIAAARQATNTTNITALVAKAIRQKWIA